MVDRMICLVPGLPGLWHRGDGQQLGICIIFASIFNFALVATFLWFDWLANWLVGLLWIVLAVAMGVSIVYNFSRWEWWFGSVVDAREASAKLALAQEQYLRGDYFEAESLVHRILAFDEPDIEAGLLLASVHRRTQRCKSALRILERLEKIEGSERWHFELVRERATIENAMSRSAEAAESEE
jgi:uncharacterized protein HemY